MCSKVQRPPGFTPLRDWTQPSVIATSLAIGLLCTLAVAWAIAGSGPPSSPSASGSFMTGGPTLLFKYYFTDRRAFAQRAICLSLPPDRTRPTLAQAFELHREAILESKNRVDLQWGQSVSPERRWPMSMPVPSPSHGNAECFEAQVFGWPFSALSACAYKLTTSSPWETEGAALAGPSGQVPGGSVWLIPLTPVWFGLVADSLFYATIAWLLIGIRTRLRTSRYSYARCPACGYARTGQTSPQCSECGFTVD